MIPILDFIYFYDNWSIWRSDVWFWKHVYLWRALVYVTCTAKVVCFGLCILLDATCLPQCENLSLFCLVQRQYMILCTKVWRRIIKNYDSSKRLLTLYTSCFSSRNTKGVCLLSTLTRYSMELNTIFNFKFLSYDFFNTSFNITFSNVLLSEQWKENKLMK